MPNKKQITVKGAMQVSIEREFTLTVPESFDPAFIMNSVTDEFEAKIRREFPFEEIEGARIVSVDPGHNQNPAVKRMASIAQTAPIQLQVNYSDFGKTAVMLVESYLSGRLQSSRLLQKLLEEHTNISTQPVDEEDIRVENKSILSKMVSEGIAIGGLGDLPSHEYARRQAQHYTDQSGSMIQMSYEDALREYYKMISRVTSKMSSSNDVFDQKNYYQLMSDLNMPITAFDTVSFGSLRKTETVLSNMIRSATSTDPETGYRAKRDYDPKTLLDRLENAIAFMVENIKSEQKAGATASVLDSKRQHAAIDLLCDMVHLNKNMLNQILIEQVHPAEPAYDYSQIKQLNRYDHETAPVMS